MVLPAEAVARNFVRPSDASPASSASPANPANPDADTDLDFDEFDQDISLADAFDESPVLGTPPPAEYEQAGADAGNHGFDVAAAAASRDEIAARALWQQMQPPPVPVPISMPPQPLPHPPGEPHPTDADDDGDGVDDDDGRKFSLNLTAEEDLANAAIGGITSESEEPYGHEHGYEHRYGYGHQHKRSEWDASPPPELAPAPLLAAGSVNATPWELRQAEQPPS